MINSLFGIGINSHTTFRYIMAASSRENPLLYKKGHNTPAFFSEEPSLITHDCHHLLLFSFFWMSATAFFISSSFLRVRQPLEEGRSPFGGGHRNEMLFPFFFQQLLKTASSLAKTLLLLLLM